MKGWPQERDAELKALREAGISTKAIANMVDVS